jgi:biopolymer transport protein ExbB
MNETAAAAAPTEQIYGIGPMLEEGGPVTWVTFGIMIIMSVVTWYILFTKLWDQRRLKAAAAVVDKQFWASGSIKEAIERLPKDNRSHRFARVDHDDAAALGRCR